MFKSMKLGLQLGLGFFVVISFLMLSIIFAYNSINNLSLLTSKLYKHPFIVSTEMLKVKANILEISKIKRDLILTQN